MTFSRQGYVADALLLCPNIGSGIVYPDIVEPPVPICTSKAMLLSDVNYRKVPD